MTIWNHRYAVEHYVYGTEPNDFLNANIAGLPKGRALCLGDGEGRNSVWLAGQGYDVTAVDISSVGLEKGRKLAKERGVVVSFVEADLAELEIGADAWDLIVSIFVPASVALRKSLHTRSIKALRPGGVFLIETYHPNQAGRDTGGGPDASTMATKEDLREDFAGFEVQHLAELERDVLEGTFHTGLGSVVQAIIRKPEGRGGNTPRAVAS